MTVTREHIQRVDSLPVIFHRLTKRGYTPSASTGAHYFPQDRKAEVPRHFEMGQWRNGQGATFYVKGDGAAANTLVRVVIPERHFALPELNGAVEFYALTPEGPRLRQVYIVGDMADRGNKRLRPQTVHKKPAL